jgi:transcriptional regulator with XRE-family HTH domain
MSKLRSAREAAGLTREQLAYEARTSVSTIARIELSGHLPNFRILDAIARVLNVAVTDIVSAERAA